MLQPHQKCWITLNEKRFKWQVVLISWFVIFTWFSHQIHYFNICIMDLVHKTKDRCQCSKITWCKLTKFFSPEDILKRISQWNFGGNQYIIVDVKIQRKFKVKQPPSWICVNIECQRTRNPLSSILIFSVVKARGVRKKWVLHRRRPSLTVYATANWIKFYKTSILHLLFEHFQFWKSTQSTTPHYLSIWKNSEGLQPISGKEELWCHNLTTCSQ